LKQSRFTFSRPHLEELESRLTMSGPGASNPGVLPPQSNPHGASYGEWAARWWQWTFAQPATNHPLSQEGNVDLSVGQSGKVWFLGGVFNATGTAERTGTIPAGKALFFPILNIEESELEANVDLNPGGAFYPTYQTAEELVRAAADSMTNMTATVDGKSISNLGAYRTVSPSFDLGPLPADNLLAGAPYNASPGTITPSIGDGYYLMLAPLSAGGHTIKFHGTNALVGFTLDITYHLTVAPASKASAASNQDLAALFAVPSSTGIASTAPVTAGLFQAPTSTNSLAQLVLPPSAQAGTTGSGGHSTQSQPSSTAALDHVFASPFENPLHLPL